MLEEVIKNVKVNRYITPFEEGKAQVQVRAEFHQVAVAVLELAAEIEDIFHSVDITEVV